MFVIRLPNGNLMAPESAMDPRGQVIGDAYVEIRPGDPHYARLSRQAVTEEEATKALHRLPRDGRVMRGMIPF